MSLKELRRRIASVKSTQKITSAMKMVASAKLRRLQERVNFGSDYLHSLNAIGQRLGKVQHDAESLSPWLSSEGHHDLVIIFGAEKGLCGSFHSNQVRTINAVIEKNTQLKLVIFGTKAIEALKAHRPKVLPIDLDFKHPNMHTFFSLAKAIEPLKRASEIGSVHVIGSAFKNILVQTPYNKVLCPFSFDTATAKHDIMIFEPAAEVFLPHFFTNIWPQICISVGWKLWRVKWHRG